MKVVVFPGVNFKMKEEHEYFLAQITKGLNCEGEIFVWEPPHVFPDFGLPLRDARDFFCGVVLDFQKVVLHALEIQVPKADIYIGHSAGSIIALVQDRPCVIMASPAIIIESMVDDSTYDEPTRRKMAAIISTVKDNAIHPVLNLINKYDIIAYPFEKPNVENYKYTGPWYNPNSYNPLAAHSDYWTNKAIINKTIAAIKSW